MPSFSNAPTSDRPTLLMVGDGDPMGPVLEEMLDKKGLFVECVGTQNVAGSVQLTIPDAILLVGDAALEARDVLSRLANDGSEIPVIVLSPDAALEARLDAFKHGAAAVVPRGASADATALQIRDLTRDLAVRFEQDTGEIGEATFDELVQLVSDELRSGILAVRAPGDESGTMRLQLGAGRPVADAVKEFVARLKPHVSEAASLNYQFHASETDLLGDAAAERAPTVFEGLRVLLVDDDPARADALAQELRARGAMVFVTDHEGRGLSRADGLDPQVAIVDAVGIEGEGFAVIRTIRAHPRLRWASILVAPWPEIWPDDRAIPDMEELAARLEPLLASERDLVERSAEEERFNTRLEETGPSRMLRTLVESHGTLHITVRSPKATVEIDVAEDLVVGARASLPDGPKPEGVSALATLMTMSSGRVRIERRERPTVANIMSPVDEALGAAVTEIPEKPLTLRPGPASSPTSPPPPNKPPSMASDRSPRRPPLPSAGMRSGWGNPTPVGPGRAGIPSPVSASERAAALAGRSERATSPLDLPAAKVDAALNLLDSTRSEASARPEPRPEPPPRPRKRPKRRRASTLVFGAAPVVPTEPSSVDVPPSEDRAPDPLEEELDQLDSELPEDVEHRAPGGEGPPEEPSPEAPSPEAPSPEEPSPEEPSPEDVPAVDAVAVSPADDTAAEVREPPAPDLPAVAGQTAPSTPSASSPGSVPAGSLPLADGSASFAPPEPPAPTPLAPAPSAAVPAMASGAPTTSVVAPTAPLPTPLASGEPTAGGRGALYGVAAVAALAALGLAAGAAYMFLGPGAAPETTEPVALTSPEPTSPETTTPPGPRDPEPGTEPTDIEPTTPEPAPSEAVQAGEPDTGEPDTGAPDTPPSDPGSVPAPSSEPAPPEDGEPQTADDFLRLARQAGDTELGERYYRHVLTLDPNEHHAMVGLGRLLMTQNRHREAVGPLRTAVRRRSRRASYRVWLGDALAGSGDAAAARREWSRALELEPDNRDAQRRLGQ